MSSDVAVLGLQIDSRPVVAAKKALDDFAAAAKPATTAAANMEKATASAGKNAAAMAANTGLARHEMINLSRQISDVGVSLASGQSPFMVLVQQGAQVADIFGSSKSGTVGGALKQFVNYVGPIRLVAGGIAGIAAAGYLASSALSGSLKALDDVAKTANTSIGALHGLQTLAGGKGISSDEFLKGMSRFADDVYRAKGGMGELAGFLRANGQSAKTFEDAIAKVAELIKNAKDDQTRLQLLQQAGLPATMEWVRLLSEGGDAFRTAIKAGDDFNNGPAAKMIARAREFDDAWNKHTTNAANAMKGWLLSLDETTFSIIDKFKLLAQNSYGSGAAPKRIEITGGTTLPKPAPTVDKNQLQFDISKAQQQLSIYGQTVTAAEAVRQVELQVQAARLSGVAIDQKRVETLKQLTAEQTIGVTAIKAQTDAARIDAATVGLGIGAATELAAAQNAINEAKRRGMELTPANITQIQKEAAALGAAAQQADTMRFAFTSLVQGPLQTFTSAIGQGASAWDAFKKAGISALNSLASKLADIAAQNLWASAFGGSGGGGFGLGSLFGLGGSGSVPVMSGTGLGAGTGGLSFPMFASGTNSAPGGWSIVGEDGPELMNVPKGAQILPNGVTPGGGSPIVMNDNRTISIGAGASPETVAQLQAAFEQDRRERANQVVQIVRRAKQGRQLP